MVDPPLRVGVSACIFHHDPKRVTFNGRVLDYLERSMSTWIAAAGALPFILPAPGEEEEVEIEDLPVGPADYIEAIDALILPGGVDVSPTSYNEHPLRPEWSGDPTRDRFEIRLIHEAMKRDRPLLGICRGHQVLNVALGGTLYQDIQTQRPDSLVHRSAEIYEFNEHAVVLEPDGWLHELYGGLERGRINSVHHQAIKDLGRGLVVEARCFEDETIEAVRYVGVGVEGEEQLPWVASVQWHPEFQHQYQTHLLNRDKLMTDFLRAAADKRRARSSERT